MVNEAMTPKMAKAIKSSARVKPGAEKAVSAEVRRCVAIMVTFVSSIVKMVSDEEGCTVSIDQLLHLVILSGIFYILNDTKCL